MSGAVPGEPESAQVDREVDAVALVLALTEVLQRRGVIDRQVWDETVRAVAERGTHS